MLFSSVSFLFVFLPLLCLAYFLVRAQFRNYLLLMASILFYAWGEPRYLAIMFITILLNYAGAIYIGKERRGNIRKILLAVFIVLNLSFLFYFKYLNFVLENLSLLLRHEIEFTEVLLPLGISFYTFQAMSYLIDVYRKQAAPQRSLYKVALYICLFPQLIAGPIVKYHEIDRQITHRDLKFPEVSYGVKRFIIGLAKKMLLANTAGHIADQMFALDPHLLGPAAAWTGAICYTMQIFYDFSGYSDMAIGLGHIFGFTFPENFNYPYISKSITEFWRRWHISLSTWFKEYLYIPLGGNRRGAGRTYFNLFLVFLATGVWHGAQWSFVLWGLWNGFFIIFERLTGWHGEKKSGWLRAAQHLYAISAFVFGWVLFRADTPQQAFVFMGRMLGTGAAAETAVRLLPGQIIALAFGVLCAVPLFCRWNEWSHTNKLRLGLTNLWLLGLFFLSVMFVASATYNPFIYFRF